MNRDDLRNLSRLRLKEAKILVRTKNFSGAYYLAGYAIECALKACIAKKVQRYQFPDKRLGQESYTHDLTALINLAGLRVHLDEESKSNNRFAAYWAITKNWTEQSRYTFKDKQSTEDLLKAITARSSGVLKWIRQYW